MVICEEDRALMKLMDKHQIKAGLLREFISKGLKVAACNSVDDQIELLHKQETVLLKIKDRINESNNSL